MDKNQFSLTGFVGGTIPYTVEILDDTTMTAEIDGNSKTLQLPYRSTSVKEIGNMLISLVIDGIDTEAAASNCTHPIESISLARVETCKNCKGETFEKKIFQCDLCGREFSL
ncbi:MAG: hypothetical protein ABFD64_02935 [Armatimonadota bacterium]